MTQTPPHSVPGTARRWRLGTRRSPLAMAQAMAVRAHLCAAHHLAEDAIEIIPVVASGDRIQDRPLAEIGGKALWTKELDRLLLDGVIDFAVHSAKDVETLRPGGMIIAAVPEREDVRDVLIGAGGGIATLPQGARIGTSAPRRAAQLLHQRPDCTIVPFRGNVATRLARLAAGEADATLLALAGLNRLGQHGVGLPLDPQIWLPAPGQGAIAVEARREDGEALALLGAIDHGPSHAALRAERALLAGLGGTCHSAVAVLTRHTGGYEGSHGDGALHLIVALFSPDGAQRIMGEAQCAYEDSMGPAALAADLLARAPVGITQYFAGASCNGR